MPNKTENLGLNLFKENEAVDFDDVNENFRIIDGCILPIESKVYTAPYSGASAGTANWHCKKFSDGTFEMKTTIEFTNLKCNVGQTSPYYTEIVTINFPFKPSVVNWVGTHLTSNSIATYEKDVTNTKVSDKIAIRFVSNSRESEAIYKQLCIKVEGAL